jgi:hypothetical protein
VTQAATAHHQLDFSLVQGGPFYRLLVRSKLQRPPTGLVYRRVLACVAIAWLPLLALTALSGTLVSGVRVPLLFDLDVSVKFLFALPLMIAAAPVVHDRIRRTVQEFLECGLVAPKDEPRYEAIVASATRLRNSAVAEAALLVLAFAVGLGHWRSAAALAGVSTWYAAPHGAASHLTAAGYWYALVSQPLVRFILFRWYFRVLVWYVLLWRVSRLELKLNPLHPDRAGGLAFLGLTVTPFSPVLVAQSSFSVGVIGNHIWHEGAALGDFKFQIAGIVAFLTLLLLVPLMFFVPQLVKAKISTSYEIGRLATRYANEFEQKWLAGSEPRDGLLGTADIQSLADLANSHAVVRSMRPVPFEARTFLRLALLVALLILPLALTMVPLEELLRGALKLLM